MRNELWPISVQMKISRSVTEVTQYWGRNSNQVPPKWNSQALTVN